MNAFSQISMEPKVDSRICLITPDRNDRPKFLEHCKWQMLNQTIRAGAHFIINDPAIEGVVDIVPRIRKGIDVAKKGGFQFCFIIENDDYYPDWYLEKMTRCFDRGADLVGIQETTIYSLQLPGYRCSSHPGRSSLFCTAFRISALDNYVWPEDTLLYFDMHLWKHTCNKQFINPFFQPTGIKHGEGFCPGNFHNGISNGKPMTKFTIDTNHSWLRRKVRTQSFLFYTRLNLKL